MADRDGDCLKADSAASFTVNPDRLWPPDMCRIRH